MGAGFPGRRNLQRNALVCLLGAVLLKERSIIFSADSGEWNTTRDSPLTLAHNVHLTVNGEDIPAVQLAKINFTTQRVEVEGSKKGVYPF